MPSNKVVNRTTGDRATHDREKPKKQNKEQTKTSNKFAILIMSIISFTLSNLNDTEKVLSKQIIKKKANSILSEREPH